MIARWLASIAIVLSLAPIASAQDDEAFRALVLQGIEEYDRQAYEEARASFEHALEIRRSARVLRGLGKVLFELRRYTASLRAFDEALSTQIDPLPEALRVEVTSLRERTAGYVGTLTILVVDDDATILVDGTQVEAGVSTPLDVGSHHVAVSAPARHPQERAVSIDGGVDQTLSVDLGEQSITIVEAPQIDDTPWVLSGILLATAGTVAAIASSAWFVEREGAVATCVRVAMDGAMCTNAGPIALERDLALWGIVIAGAATLAGATTLIAGTLLRSSEPQVACAPAPDGFGCAMRMRL